MTTHRSELQLRLAYLLASLVLVLSQNLLAWWAWTSHRPGEATLLDFWLFPLRSPLEVHNLPPVLGAALMFYCLLVAGTLAHLSFGIAKRTKRGFLLAFLSVIPIVQLGAIALNAVLPSRGPLPDKLSPHAHNMRSIVLGLVAGVALIVVAVLVSAVTFGAYGWGLFVLTPCLVGVTTGYLANSRADIGVTLTMKLVIGATALGGGVLVLLALEGIFCILLAAPLAAPCAMLGGILGRLLAIARLKRCAPLVSIAILPVIFMVEAVAPPEASIAMHDEIAIDASAETVWRSLTSPAPIEVAPGLPGDIGLAYPLSSELQGEGVGAVRIGVFSTGEAIEEITEWRPNEALAFRVRRHPPAMEEMSPYRRVHAPHVQGYFLTGETRFVLTPSPTGQTLLRLASEHRLRIDPTIYWEPIARIAIRLNMGRVLQDIKIKSENKISNNQQ